MQLIIAEKPSVGAAIAAAGTSGRKKVYIAGSNRIVSLFIGHLAGL